VKKRDLKTFVYEDFLARRRNNEQKIDKSNLLRHNLDNETESIQLPQSWLSPQVRSHHKDFFPAHSAPIDVQRVIGK
jgi:hypothetical protein